MTNYYAYRISLIQPTQYELFVKEKTKYELINQVIATLQSSIKRNFSNSEKRYLVYYKRRIDGTIYLLQLARENIIIEPIEGDEGIEEKEAIVFPYIYVILDIDKQIVLIQNKTQVFSTTDISSNRIADFFEYELRDENIVVKLESIASAEDVWKKISEAKHIYELDLDVNPPNFFGSRFKSNIDIKEAHEETNFTKFKIIIRNKFGQLRVARDDFQDIIQTLASGAGNFVIEMMDKMGEIIKITNFSQIRKVKLPDDTDLIDGQKLREDIDELDKLNDNPKDDGQNFHEPQ